MKIGKDWRDMIDVDPPADKPITHETILQTIKESKRFRGSVRLSTGKIWTDEEYEERRKKVLSTPLP